MNQFPNPNQTDEDEIKLQKERIRQENVRREMERVSQDLILVANPEHIIVKVGKDTMMIPSENAVVDWDGFKHAIQAGTQKQWRRYIAIKYVREMKNLIINKMSTIKFEQMMAERSKKGMAELTPFERQEIWNRTFNTEDPTLMAQIYPQFWLGVVEEYGLDAEPETGIRPDFRTEEEKLLQSLGTKRAVVAPEPKTPDLEPLQDVNQAKENAMKGVKA